MTDSNFNTDNSAFQATEPDMQPIYNSGIPLLPDPGFLWQVFRRNLLMFLIILCIVGGLTAALLRTRQLRSDENPITEEQIEAMASQILGTIRVSRSGQTRIADITGVSRDPEFAANAANAVAQAYLTSQVEAKTSRTDASGAFINTRLKELETNALNAQARLDTYKSERGLVSAQGLTNADQEVRLLNTLKGNKRKLN